MAERLLPGLERRLKAEISGGVQFDRFTRGRYATDASHYQIMPLGVVTPRTMDEAERAIAIARAEGVTVLPRGGGSSQAGQTVNASLVIDCSKHLTRILDLLTDYEGRLRDAVSKRIFVEVALLKAIEARRAVSIDTVIQKLQGLRSGSVAQPPAPAARHD